MVARRPHGRNPAAGLLIHLPAVRRKLAFLISSQMARSRGVLNLFSWLALVHCSIRLDGSLSVYAQSHDMARSRIMLNLLLWLARTLCSIRLYGSLSDDAQSTTMARSGLVLNQVLWLALICCSIS